MKHIIGSRPTSCTNLFVQIALVDANVINYSDTGLSPGTVYYYRVCAYNEADNSDYSNKDAAVTFADVTTLEELTELPNRYNEQGVFKFK